MKTFTEWLDVECARAYPTISEVNGYLDYVFKHRQDPPLLMGDWRKTYGSSPLRPGMVYSSVADAEYRRGLKDGSSCNQTVEHLLPDFVHKSVADAEYQRGYKEGTNQNSGFCKGQRQGWNDGHRIGHAEGKKMQERKEGDEYQKGLKEGTDRGYADGKAFVVAAADAAIEKGYHKGLKDGHCHSVESENAARESGYNKGLLDARTATIKARKEGYNHGHVDGKIKGRSEWERAAIDRSAIERAARKCANTYCGTDKEAYEALCALRVALSIDTATVWRRGKYQ